MKRILSKQAAWYGNGRPVNINPSRWEADKGIGMGEGATGTKTEDEVKEEGWGQKEDKKDKKSDKKKHKVDCPCGKNCKCKGTCKCRR